MAQKGGMGAFMDLGPRRDTSWERFMKTLRKNGLNSIFVLVVIAIIILLVLGYIKV